MGVESGDGDASPQSSNQWGTSPRNFDISYVFLTSIKILRFQHFQRKWPKSEEKLNFGGKWFGWLTPSPNATFLATLLIRKTRKQLRGWYGHGRVLVIYMKSLNWHQHAVKIKMP